MHRQAQFALLEWYRQNARDLPWRRTRDPYRILVSEIMLQQTTVAAVQPLYLRWLRRFPTIEALAAAGLEEVMAYWSGLGYYQRARRLHECARKIHDEGEMPQTYESLLKLPGIGSYTAAAVASIAFSGHHLALDTNAIRVLFRYHGIRQLSNHGPSLRRLRESLEPALAGSEPGSFNQALIELGALVCTAREAKCDMCCLKPQCRARNQGAQSEIPRRPPPKKPRLTPGVAYLVQKDSTVMLLKGTTLGLLPDLYQPPLDFPVHNKPGLLQTPFMERVRAVAADAPLLDFNLSYGISGRKLQLQAKSVPVELLEPLASGFPEHRWVCPTSPRVAVSSLTRKIFRAMVASEIPEAAPLLDDR